MTAIKDNCTVATLIVPCWNAAGTLEACLACVRAQTLTDFEAIFVDDGSTDGTAAILASAAAEDSRIRVITQQNRGVSAARNAGLDAARGEYVFFADPDDTFSPEMLARGVAAMEADGADYCAFAYRQRDVTEKEFRLVALKGDYRYRTNAEVRAGFMSRMFGYSPAQVRAWYAGTPLFAHREQGGVWRCVYRRAIIEAHHVRFDEEISLYEDAMFNCEYMLHAQSMTCIPDPLYDYALQARGAIARLRRSRRELTNKLALLRRRKAIDSAAGGALAESYSCSCVFSLLEMLTLVFRTDVPFREGFRLVREYAADATVRRALREFPLSARKPFLALSVIVLRVLLPA